MLLAFLCTQNCDASQTEIDYVYRECVCVYIYIYIYTALFVYYEVFNVCVHFHQADSKLREEEKRALRYLETRRDCNSVQAVSVLQSHSNVLWSVLSLLQSETCVNKMQFLFLYIFLYTFFFFTVFCISFNFMLMHLHFFLYLCVYTCIHLTFIFTFYEKNSLGKYVLVRFLCFRLILEISQLSLVFNHRN